MKGILLLFSLVLLSFVVCAQQTLTFTVQLRDPLFSDAGKDTIIQKGAQIRIGGEVPARGGSGNYSYLWSPTTGISDPTIANPIASPDSSVTYTLTVSDQYCISESTITLEVDEITGIEPYPDLGMKLYPNPNKGSFWITTEHGLGEREVLIRVFDSHGQEIFNKSADGKEKLNESIDLGIHAKGIYMVWVSTKSRSFIYSTFIY